LPSHHIPVVSLVKVVVEANQRASALVRATPLHHLAPKGKPRATVGLEKTPTFIAVDVELDDDDVNDSFGGSDVGHAQDSNRPKPPR
jgi:hypothetical protein